MILGAVVLTVCWTHIWVHLLLFGFLLAGAEAEYWVLRVAPEQLEPPIMVRFEPMALEEDFEDDHGASPAFQRFSLVVRAS